MKLPLAMAALVAASIGSGQAYGGAAPSATPWGWCVRIDLVCTRRVSNRRCMARAKRVRWISCPVWSANSPDAIEAYKWRRTRADDRATGANWNSRTMKTRKATTITVPVFQSGALANPAAIDGASKPGAHRIWSALV